MKTREEIELMYWQQCAQCRGRFPPPLPPPWMPDHYGRRAELKREAEAREAKLLKKASRKPRWYERIFNSRDMPP